MNRVPGVARLAGVMRRRRFVLFFRMALILGAALGAFWLWMLSFRVWAVLTTLVVLSQLPSLVRFVERPSREMLRFLESIRNDDFSISFGRRSASLSDPLRAAYTDVVATFQQIRSEREEQAHFLQTIVRHVGVALIAYRSDGDIMLFNEAAGRLLGLSRPRTMDRIARRHPALVESLLGMRRGVRGIVEMERDDQPLTLIIHATRFQLGGMVTTLASLQDIRPELEAKELEAWQSLTRVLTHEMVNSVSPIASLAATAQELIGDSESVHEGIGEALRVIKGRCEHLVQFVESYRSLAGLPEPSFQIEKATRILNDVATLLRATAIEQGMQLRVDVKPQLLDLIVDSEMFEQALVNVVFNAIQACEGREDATVVLRAFSGALGRPVVEVVDNGPGLIPDVIDSVFMPFFTTRPGGSGIGLSLSREIMRRHGGTLSVRSIPETETVFTFRF